MRKVLLFLLIALLGLTMCACSSGRATVYTVENSWGALTVDTENHTITSGENTYRYTYTGGSRGYNVEITYPDGSTWRQESYDGTSFTIGWSDGYDPGSGKYLAGDVLSEALQEKAPGRNKRKNPLPSLLLLCAGIFSLASPRSAWYLSYGWHFKDAEPSGLALFANRAAGVVFVVAAAVIFLV